MAKDLPKLLRFSKPYGVSEGTLEVRFPNGDYRYTIPHIDAYIFEENKLFNTDKKRIKNIGKLVALAKKLNWKVGKLRKSKISSEIETIKKLLK